MPKFRAALIAGFTVLLSACSPFGIINLMVPKAGYSVHRGVAYGTDPRQALDIYVPDGLQSPAPVLLFFYGGSWESGERGDYLAFGQAFASRGIVTVIADYRLYPKVGWPAFVEDAASALALVHRNITAYGGDPARVFVSGHSAGAYNAVMLASDPRYLKAVGGDFSWIRGVIGIAGPYDFLPLKSADLIDIFHGPDNREVLPLSHIDGKRPPMLLLHGTADTTVGPQNSKSLAHVLRTHGSMVEEIYYKDVGHIGIILSLLPPFRGRTSLREDMLKFIATQSR
jgi:acetyl esterase/lipase